MSEKIKQWIVLFRHAKANGPWMACVTKGEDGYGNILREVSWDTQEEADKAARLFKSRDNNVTEAWATHRDAWI